MTRFRAGFLLVVLLALGALSAALGPPSRAQTSPAPPFPFADTTLLRDTLGLHFDGLFELADSLRVRADTLRALSVRYGYSLGRLIALADSLRVPVDSVGPVLLRERFNPLASQVERTSSFRYGSTYNILQTSSVWGNTADYSFVLGPLFVQNTTNISMDRRIAGGRVGLRQTRSSSTEVGWKFSPDFSVGGRANLSRFDNLSSSGTSRDAVTKNEYQFSVRNRQAPAPGLNSEINFFTGLLDVTDARQNKNGFSSDLSGRMSYQRGNWLTNDLDGQVTGNFSRASAPNRTDKQDTRDFSSNVRGTLGLFSESRISGNLGYNFRWVRVESPSSLGGTERIRTDDNGLNASLRLRLDGSRYLNVDQTLTGTRQATVQSVAEENTRTENTLDLSGGYRIGLWSLTGRFSNGFSTNKYPARDSSGGYREDAHPRSIDVTVTRPLAPRITLLGSTGVTLSSYRYAVIRNYASPPVSRDQYRQFYRLDVMYARNIRSSTGVALDVSRSLDVNLPSASTAANSETRSYRAEWRWSYQLLQGLTATQRNQVAADYLSYTFLPRNNRLTLDYNSITTLNAAVTRRLRIDLTHTTRQQPSGNYVAIDATRAPYFSQADESRSLTLSSTISYTPIPTLSLTLQTDYFGTEREGTSNGRIVPQRTNRSLNFSGGANLNVPLGAKGRLTGNISRSARADRNTQFQSGVPQPSPSSRTDFWNGRLAVSWGM